MSKFQMIVIAVFSVVALVAILMFAGLIPGFKSMGGKKTGDKIIMWSAFSRGEMNPMIYDLNDENRSLFSIKYFEKKPNSYESELMDALASGTGPDIWLITQSAVLKTKNKVFQIPFESFSERAFSDAFIDSAEVFLDMNGKSAVGIPVAVDPIVMYWNRDMFSSAGIARPPEYWSEFLLDVEKLTKRDGAGNIIQSGAALGEFRNIKNAKDILSMLILQGGSKIVDPVSLKISSDNIGRDIFDPTENAVIFFNEFSNPTKSSYSWNRALPSSDEMFVNGSLAMYFGYASELPDIKKKNPHLNFDVAVVPQIKKSPIKATFGKIFSAVISKSSQHTQSAFSAVFKLAGEKFSKRFAQTFYMAPARRDLLAAGSNDPDFSIFYKSAVMARTWLEPDPQKVYKIFQNMVESTATGRLKVSAAVKEEKNRLDRLLKEFYVE